MAPEAAPPVSLVKTGGTAGGPAPAAEGAEPAFEGCLVRVVRMPVRIVTLVLVLPVRMVWDALTVCGRALRRTLWVPFARVTGRAAAWLWHTVLAPVLFALFVWPWLALWRYLLVPVGSALGWLGRTLVVVPLGLLYGCVLTPLGHGLVAVASAVGAGLGWLWRWLVVAPCLFVHRWLLRPAGRGVAVVAGEVADAVGHAWRVAGHVSRAVFRFFGRVLRFLFADPAVWLWRHVVMPVHQGLRDLVYRPVAHAVREAGRSVRAALAAARASVRQTRTELQRALFGGRPHGESAPEPAEPVAEYVPDRRVPSGEGRVPWVAGSPHNSATTPGTFGPKRDDADFRTL